MAGKASRLNGMKGGRPPGAKSASTYTKEQAREALRQIVLQHMDDMVSAQVAHSKGLKYLVTRDKGTGKFIRVTAAMAGAFKGDEVVEVWEKEPSVPAFTDLMNRALDKPIEAHEVTGKDGGPIEIIVRKSW